MTAFESALKFTLKHEGGYRNDPNDTGGETNFGISDRRDGVVDGKADLNGDRVPDVAIKDLTQEQAAIVYNREYWTPCKCEQLHPAVAMIVFDTAVNAGNHQAAKLLQRALKLNEDGQIGPRTIAAANADPKRTVLNMATERTLHNASLKSWPHFGRGWTRRVIDLTFVAVSLT